MANVGDLLGAWELCSWIVRLSDDGTERYPFGHDARGRLHYASDGIISATIARNDRAVPLSSDDLRHILRNYMHYTGRFELRDGIVYHAVDFALDPSLVGRCLQRNVMLSGDDLVLTGNDHHPRHGREIIHILRWRRAGTGAGVGAGTGNAD